MKHEDMMIFHRIKYKHIAFLILIVSTIVSYNYADFNADKVTFSFLVFICCIASLVFIILNIFISNWDDKIL